MTLPPSCPGLRKGLMFRSKLALFVHMITVGCTSLTPTQQPSESKPSTGGLVYVSNATALRSAITSNTTIELKGGIELPQTGYNDSQFFFTILGPVKGLRINFNGFTIGFSSLNSSNGGIFNVSDGAEVVFSEFNVRNAYSDKRGGAIYTRKATIRFEGNATFTSCKAQLRGGALYSRKSNIEFKSSAFFSSCESPGRGGAIYHFLGNMIFKGSTRFQKCEADDRAGAIYNKGDIHFEDTAHFLSCKAGRGGAIYNNAGDLIFNGTAEFHSCVAEKKFGGGIFLNYGSIITSTTSTTSIMFVNCTARSAAAIFNNAGGALLHAPFFSNNKPNDIEGLLHCENLCSSGKYGFSLRYATFPSDDIAKSQCPSYEGCFECPAGRYIADTSVPLSTSINDCSDCGAGRISADGAKKCLSCIAGRYATNSANDTGGGLDVQVPAGATICRNCPPGTAAPYDTTIVCSRCFAGKTSSSGQVQCSSCLEGTYSNVGEPACSSCEVGKYNNEVGASSCTSCTKGSYAMNVGSTSCVECAPGSFASMTGAEMCTLCEPGTFSENNGEVICKVCVPPTTTAGKGATNCSACIDKYYWNNHIATTYRETCTSCPDGVNCSSLQHRNLETLLIEEGYFRFSASATTIYECSSTKSIAKKQCVGGKTTGKALCAKNFKGPLCSNCVENYYRSNDGNCEKCSAENIARSTTWVLITVGSMLVTVLLLYSRYTHFAIERIRIWFENHTVKLEWTGVTARIIFYDYQIISKFTQLNDVDWPGAFRWLVNTMSGINLDFVILFPSLACSSGFSQYDIFIVWITTPVVVYGFVLVTILGWTFHADPQSSVSKSAMKTTSQFFEVLSLVHTLICVEIFRIFDCDSYEFGTAAEEPDYIANGKVSFLAADYSIKCNTDQHRAYEALAYVAIVVYVGIVPIVMMKLKEKKQEHIRKTGRIPGLQESPYKPSWWFFDTIHLIYRLAMTGMLLLVFDKSERRMIQSSFISLLFLAFVAQARPFLTSSHNNLLFTGQLVVTITVLCGIILEIFVDQVKHNNVPKQEKTYMGSFLLTVNVLVVIFAFWQQRTERLHDFLDTIKQLKHFDAKVFSTLWSGASKRALGNGLLLAANSVIQRIRSAKSDDEADRAWEYLTRQLLVLQVADSSGGSVWNEDFPGEAKAWNALIVDVLERKMRAVEDENSDMDENSFALVVQGVFGPFIDDATARALFQYLLVNNSPGDLDRCSTAPSRPQSLSNIDITRMQWKKNAKTKQTTINPMTEMIICRDMFTEIESPELNGILAHGQVVEGLQMLQRALTIAASGSSDEQGVRRPTMFAIVQFLGIDWHESILQQQKTAAASMLSNPAGGSRLKELKHPGIPDEMRQKVALTMSTFIKKACVAEGFIDVLDEEIIPTVLCAISSKVRPFFQAALLDAVPGATLYDGGSGSHSKSETSVSTVELKVGPTKRANRISVKIAEYRLEKDEWPYAQFVTDVMRASFICETAEDFVRAYGGIEASDHFQVVRMKNKIGKCQGPFNLHINVLFEPVECEDPILCEIQFYPKAVYQLQHCQHLAYELRRATSVTDLI